MSARKYVSSLMAVLYMFMIINLALWHGIVKDTFTGRDLNRLGSIATSESLTPEAKYSEHHTKFADYIASGKHESFDVLTIGDSFSSGAYQDYLVNNYGLKILNVRLENYDCLTALYMLASSGWLDDISPEAVILESVERSVQNRLGRELIKPVTADKQEVEHLLQKSDVKLSDGFMPPIMFQANFKHIYHKLYHLIKPEQLSSEVYITELDRKFFTNPSHENTLLHYYEDLHYLTNPINAEIVNQNLNNAASLLKDKGIKLIFFAGIDKYDLYYPYILDKKNRPENQFFQKMRSVSGKNYVFIDSMTPLREALGRGEQDVYWLSDTHWSHKGIKIVCDELIKYILP